MANSVVYKDGHLYVTLVSHGSDRVLERLGFELSGLLHYCTGEDGKTLEIFDGTSGTFYEVDIWWNGVDQDAVRDLEDAVDRKFGAQLDDRYYEAIELYAKAVENELVREALA